MSRTFDLIVIGSGTAGATIAQKCRAADWSVAVVEERELGGTCALRGCEPKKTLWTMAEAVDRARRLSDAGLSGGKDVHVDWPTTMRFKRTFTDPMPEMRRESFEKAGIEIFAGHASFLAPDRLAVGREELAGEHIVIATGARPTPLPIPGVELLTTSDDFLELERMPERILLLGGGYISFEFAHIARRAGAEVTMLQKGDKALAAFDQELVARLVEHSRHVGIEIVFDAEVDGIEAAADGGRTVRTKTGESYTAPIAVHGLGRRPNIDALDLEAANVATADGKLRLDAGLRSLTNPKVFAAGDAASVGAPLTPVSLQDADRVAHNLLMAGTEEPFYRGTTSVVFTIPPLAKTGLTQDEAEKAGYTVEATAGDMGGFQSVRREGHENSGARYRIISDKRNGQILGAHLFAPNAHEVINMFALAVRHKLTRADLKDLMPAYPSGGSDTGSMLG